MIMRRLSIPIAVLATVGLAVAAYAVNSRDLAERPDCPGKIVCPRTGELICRDKCPTADPNRSDCPGRVVCPLTGQRVCQDRCPLNKGEPATSSDTPSCCQGGK
jgi:hypothetical protein